MLKIEGFKELREDGKVITEAMGFNEVCAMGVSRVLAVEWSSGGSNHRFEDFNGILAEVLPDRSGIVYFTDGAFLVVLNPDGSERFKITSSSLAGVVGAQLGWFEPSSNSNSICVVIETPNGNTQVEIDTVSSEILRKRNDIR